MTYTMYARQTTTSAQRKGANHMKTTLTNDKTGLTIEHYTGSNTFNIYDRNGNPLDCFTVYKNGSKDKWTEQEAIQIMKEHFEEMES